MSYKPLRRINFYQAFKVTTAFLALFLASAIIFYPKLTTSQSTTNYLGLPACNGSTLNQHRINCADLIDLPLCIDVNDDSSGSAVPKTNCVNECSSIAQDPDNSKIRGLDYAIHGQDCIRFCDTLSGSEAGITLNQTGTGGQPINCIKRQCHQLPIDSSKTDGSYIQPTNNNCTRTRCDLLTVNELNNTKFNFDNTTYDEDDPHSPQPPFFCDGTKLNPTTGIRQDIKCYEFAQNKLPFIKMYPVNRMCKIHDCKPPSTGCKLADGSVRPDDTLNITNNNSTLNGKTYTQDYVKYINAGYAIDNQSTCNQIQCRPVIKRPYSCIGSDQNTPVSDCDSGIPCVSGYCYKTINCNSSAFSNEPECIVNNSPEPAPDSEVEATDSMNSWFYRPAPMDKATKIVNGKRVLRDMQPQLCYTASQFKANSGWGLKIPILGYFHSPYDPDDTRSPGRCMSSWGGTGTGFIYLCGTKNYIGSSVSDYTAYHKGYVVTRYSQNEGEHKLAVCLRFYNEAMPWAAGSGETCGKRECAVTANFGDWTGQTCGGDRCRILTIKGSDPKECDNLESNDVSNQNAKSKGCMAKFNSAGMASGYLRVRAVKYGYRICTFIDALGIRGDNDGLLDANAKLSDGTCIAGTNSNGTSMSGTCNDAQSNKSDVATLTRWRTILKIPYIKNNQPDGLGARGYIDQNGRLFKEQECINIRPRIAPPRMYNLANKDNTPKLFIPPLYISQVMIKKDGPAVVPNGDDLGATDFNYPEIEITFGSIKKKLSLSLDKIGNETSGADSKASTDITSTTSDGLEFSISIFIKKELDVKNNQPLLCLYRKLFDENNSPLPPLQVQCVKRAFPEVNNSTQKEGVVIGKTTIPNDLNNSKITLSYANYGANSNNDNCALDDSCTRTITLDTPDASSSSCNSDIENYKVCATRDECTKLYVECLQNEVDIQYAINNNQQTSTLINFRNYCNNDLLSSCYAKIGMNVPTGTSILDAANPFTATPPANAYGIFPEICMTTGFETKLRRIVAKQFAGGIGKCVIDPVKSRGAADCSKGGNQKIGCYCLEYNENADINSDEEVRNETFREAGLCIDMDAPQYCSRINYNPTFADENSSLNALPSQAIAQFHIDRTNNTNSSNVDSGHAEFSSVVPGTSNVTGYCHGFWKEGLNSPKMSCSYGNTSTDAPTWSNMLNPCIRHSCPQITTAGPDTNGVYQGGYSSGETGDDVGKSNGYAMWPGYTKTNDYLEKVNALMCIPGYKKPGSTAVTTTDADGNKKITSYNGGTTPVRSCNQLGKWLQPGQGLSDTDVSACQRITCPAINPTDPTTLTANSDAYWEAWSAWNDSKGATFPEALASRRPGSDVSAEHPLPTDPNVVDTPNTVVRGICNEKLGFFQSPGGQPPTRACDSMGNWLPIKNPCVTRCNAVTDTSNPPANDPSSGYAYWTQGTSSSTDSNFFNGCYLDTTVDPNIQYVPNPYPPIKDKYGNLLPTEVANDLSRPAGPPQRICSEMMNGISIWGAPNSSCIKYCPGANTDPRIGVGITQHNVSFSSTPINIEWHDNVPLGGIDTISNCGGIQANRFAQDRPGDTDNCYVLRRACGTDGKWGDPIPVCIARFNTFLSDGRTADPGGELENATYDLGVDPGYGNSLAAISAPDTSQPSVTGVCKTGYWNGDSTSGHPGTTPPRRQCLFESGNTNIDRVYLGLTTDNCIRIQCPATTLAKATSAAATWTTSVWGIPITHYRTADTALTSGYYGDTQPVNCSSETSALNGRPMSSCQVDGTWSQPSGADIQAHCKRWCTVPATANISGLQQGLGTSISSTGNYVWYWKNGYSHLDDDGGGGTAGVKWDSFTLRHGESFALNLFGSDGYGSSTSRLADVKYGCSEWYFGAKCNDGTLNIRGIAVDSNNRNRIWGDTPATVDYGCSNYSCKGCIVRAYDPVNNVFLPASAYESDYSHISYPNGYYFYDKDGNRVDLRTLLTSYLISG